MSSGSLENNFAASISNDDIRYTTCVLHIYNHQLPHMGWYAIKHNQTNVFNQVLKNKIGF